MGDKWKTTGQQLKKPWRNWETTSGTPRLGDNWVTSGRPCGERIGQVEEHIAVTSSTAQGGGGTFKNRKPIGEVGCCESRMAERIH